MCPPAKKKDRLCPPAGVECFSWFSTNSTSHQAKPPQSLQDEEGGEAMGREASGRGAREDRRTAQQPAEAQPAVAAGGEEEVSARSTVQ